MIPMMLSMLPTYRFGHFRYVVLDWDWHFERCRDARFNDTVSFRYLRNHGLSQS